MRTCITVLLLVCRSLRKSQHGRGERIRTSGIQLPKLALYQAELHPDARFVRGFGPIGKEGLRWRTIAPFRIEAPTDRQATEAPA
ncbi:hypothetical protein MTBSS4_130086 [Magnetospirillum sp. SS-4]|nr:hypothetical protein MTBSS4_130086 [Magnetospirillum sp. SS-4]